MYELLLWLVSLFSFTPPAVTYGAAPQQDYVGMVAAEAAYSAALPGSAPVKPKKPIDPDCGTCRGTGKVKSGDGLGWSPCPTCQAEEVGATEPNAPIAPIQKPTRMPIQTR
jgi:hypothetical protein